MKNKLLAIILLSVPAIVVAQTPTRERRSDGATELRTEPSAIRERVVGPQPANHASATKTKPKEDTSTREQVQTAPTTSWGNASVILRPTQTTKPVILSQPTVSKTVADNAETKKLVQPTSLISDSRSSSSSTRPLASAKAISATGIYKVGVGDVLDVRLPSVPTRESTLFTVMKNGTLEYPLLSGPVSVAGLTPEEVASLLTREIKVIRAARVTVSVRDYSSHTVVISGLVDSPGRKVLRREALPLYAVLAEAMVRSEATTATLVRNGKESGALLLNDDQAMATLVQAGDVIKINGAGVSPTQFLYVGGAVSSPGEKVFREGMTLTQVLLSAGGATRTDNPVVKIARRNANGFLSTSEYKLRSIEEGKLPDPVVQPGDRIEVSKSM